MIKILNNFDLDSTITCGQIFRYEVLKDSYIVVLKDRVIEFNHYEVTGIISFEEFKLMNEKIMEIENGYNKC